MTRLIAGGSPRAAYGTRYAALRNESAWDRLLPTSDTANTLTTVQSIGSPQAGSEGRNAAPGSPFMTFTAGGAYVDDSNEGRWGATSAGTTTGYMSVLMQTDSPYLLIHTRSWPAHRFRLQVDGKYLTPKEGTAGPADGGHLWLRIDFTDTTRPHTMKLSQVGGQIYEVHTAPGRSVWSIPPRGQRVAVLGDSYSGGAGEPPTGFSGMSSWVATLADLLGWDDVINAGVGGRGWIAPGSSNEPAPQAVPRIASWNPDVVIFALGQNDSGSTNAAVGAAVTQTLAATQAALPAALLVVTGGFHAGAPLNGSDDPYWGPQQAAIFAAAQPFGALLVPTTNRAIFTGTGKAGSPGTGNGSGFIQSDGVHPTQAGADYLGYRMYADLLRALAS